MKSAAEFWEHVAVGGDDDCWLWRRCISASGYGLTYVAGRQVVAHRIAWQIANSRPWPNGLIARHTCDNPKCVNPRHVIPGTPAENARDMMDRNRVGGQVAKNRRKTHCSKGHPLTPENVYVYAKGHRICKVCQYAAKRRYIERQRAAAL